MRSRTSDWYETKIRYEKTMEDGMQKKVSEQYVVDALSFTEAENKIIEEMSSYISGELTITDIKHASYKAKLQFITIDEKTEKEKRTAVYYLVQASSFPGAVKHIEEVMGTTQIDYVISNLAETMIMDVYEHVTTKKPAERNDVPEYEQAEQTKEGEQV